MARADVSTLPPTMPYGPTGKTKALIFGSEYNINLLRGLNLPGVEVQDNILAPFRQYSN